MQLQVLKLEDGEYAKANGGFSLIRAGVKTGGSSLKRLTVDEVNKSVAAAKQSSLGIMTKGVSASATCVFPVEFALYACLSSTDIQLLLS